jgi:hypothetical protein
MQRPPAQKTRPWTTIQGLHQPRRGQLAASLSPEDLIADLLMMVVDIDLDTLARGGIFVFSLDGKLCLKRLQLMSNGDLKIISDNKAHATKTIRGDELECRIVVHGLVFWAGGPLHGRAC